MLHDNISYKPSLVEAHSRSGSYGHPGRAPVYSNEKNALHGQIMTVVHTAHVYILVCCYSNILLLMYM